MAILSQQPTILITGGSDGIGLALARRYHNSGAGLIVVGKRPLDALDEPFLTADRYCQADLSHVDCANVICDWLAAHDIEALNLLIHNAGIGFVGEIAAQSATNIRMLEAVNLRAPIALTHRLLPLVERAAGKVVFIGSVASVMPTPEYAVYSATKAALDAFVRNLQIELTAANSPARAQMIHPGATRTGIHVKSGLSKEQVDWSRFPPADEVAAQIEQIINGKRRTTAPGFSNNLALQSLRRFPGFGHRIARRTAIRGLVNKDVDGDETTVQSISDNAQTDQTSDPTIDAPANEQPLHCVITGAADGIGRALALAFAAEGYTITGVDLDAEQAMRTQAEIINQGGKARFIIADLSVEEHLTRIVTQLSTRPPIDLLVHNAGINAVGAFAANPLEAQMKVLDINFSAPMLLTGQLLADQRLVDDGSIVCISSLSHFAGYPGAAVYAASKSGLASYAASLDVDLMPQNINVLTVFPGPTRTAHARRYSPDNSREARRMHPETLAQQIVDAVHARRRQLIPGAINRIFGFAGRFTPGLTERVMRKTILEKLTELGEVV